MGLFDIFLNDTFGKNFASCLRKFRSGDFESQRVRDGQFESDFDRFSQQSDTRFESNTTEYQEPPKSSKPQTKNMLVLGELHRGVRLFENIQKNTGLTTEELNSILEDLENNGLMKTQQKSGLFGMKTELVPTDKGFKEYYS